jgi:two-component system chemotaxis response regulator CheB
MDERGASRDIVVVGGSTGAVEALRALVRSLPGDLAAAVLVALHIGNASSSLPRLLSRAGPLPARHAVDGDRIRRGHIYIAPPDYHLLVAAGHLRLSRGPREHFTRPAIDPLFRTASSAYGPRVIALLLSGTGGDGAAGLASVRAAGGLAVVQDPREAGFRHMPQNAIDTVGVDTIAPVATIARFLAEKARPCETTSAEDETAMTDEQEQFEHPTTLTCPECGGAVRDETLEGMIVQRCHIGHRFSGQSLAAVQLEQIEKAMNVAVRVLNERGELCRRMIEQLRASGRNALLPRWEAARREAEEQRDVLRHFSLRSWLRPEDYEGSDEDAAANQ